MSFVFNILSIEKKLFDFNGIKNFFTYILFILSGICKFNNIFPNLNKQPSSMLIDINILLYFFDNDIIHDFILKFKNPFFI